MTNTSTVEDILRRGFLQLNYSCDAEKITKYNSIQYNFLNYDNISWFNFFVFPSPSCLPKHYKWKKSQHRIQLFIWWNFWDNYKTLSWGGSVLELLDKGRASIHGFPKGVQDPTPLPTQTTRIPWFLIILLSLILANPPDLGGQLTRLGWKELCWSP